MHEGLRKSKVKLMINTLCRCTVSGFVVLAGAGFFSSRHEAE